MTTNDFLRLFRKMLSHSHCFPGEEVSIEVLLNPKAGMIRRQKHLRNVCSTLESRLEQSTRQTRDSIAVRIHELQDRPGFSEETVSIVHSLASDVSVRRKILVLAGGDGFHKDVVTALLRFDPGVLDSLLLFRLPLGTGNDTSDAPDFETACEVLSEGSRIRSDSYIAVDIQGHDDEYALNVASFGLDAYVCELTNRFKGSIPGDIYKVMVDLSTLFFDFKYKTYPMKITIDEGSSGVYHEIESRLILTVLGRKGGTNYGGGRKILPGSENLLLADFMGIGKRIKLKGEFMTGSHREREEAHFFHADTVTFSYPEEILMELDGEVYPLGPENFPVTMNVQKDRLNILSR